MQFYKFVRTQPFVPPLEAATRTEIQLLNPKPDLSREKQYELWKCSRVVIETDKNIFLRQKNQESNSKFGWECFRVNEG